MAIAWIPGPLQHSARSGNIWLPTIRRHVLEATEASYVLPSRRRRGASWRRLFWKLNIVAALVVAGAAIGASSMLALLGLH